MNPEGYNSINQALHEAGILAVVTPKPFEGEDLTYITVATDIAIQPANVLNALLKERLMLDGGDQSARQGWRKRPELKIVGILPGSITFEDVNYATRKQ